MGDEGENSCPSPECIHRVSTLRAWQYPTPTKTLYFKFALSSSSFLSSAMSLQVYGIPLAALAKKRSNGCKKTTSTLNLSISRIIPPIDRRSKPGCKPWAANRCEIRQGSLIEHSPTTNKLGQTHSGLSPSIEMPCCSSVLCLSEMGQPYSLVSQTKKRV